MGEGLIYDLRVALFDHVQRMPLAFFTRTQTGALQSRLNNDVIGAQQAVTTTLGTVVSNVINLAVVLTIMLQARAGGSRSSRCSCCPLFIWPARRIGPRMQKLTREGMQLNAEMNNLTVERFNVAGAMLAKLFGRPRRERDALRDPRRRRARHRRAHRDLRPDPVRRARARRRGRHRGRLPRRRQPRDLGHDHDRAPSSRS